MTVFSAELLMTKKRLDTHPETSRSSPEVQIKIGTGGDREDGQSPSSGHLGPRGEKWNVDASGISGRP